MPVDIVTALIGLAGIAIGSVATYLATRKTNATNLRIATEKLESENRLTNQASNAIAELLRHPKWELRSFEAISKHVRGFEDDELRKLLVASGAVSFEQVGTGRELWGLRERNAGRLAPDPNAEPFMTHAVAAGPAPPFPEIFVTG